MTSTHTVTPWGHSHVGEGHVHLLCEINPELAVNGKQFDYVLFSIIHQKDGKVDSAVFCTDKESALDHCGLHTWYSNWDNQDPNSEFAVCSPSDILANLDWILAPDLTFPPDEMLFPCKVELRSDVKDK